MDSEAAFTRRWWQAMEVLYETAAQLVLYVLFLLLFTLAVQHLRHSKTASAPRLLWVAWVMLSLSTTQISLGVGLSVLALRLLRLDVQGDTRAQIVFVANRISFARLALLIANNALTDGLYILQCYFVWEKKKSVIVFPILLLTTATIMGYISAVETNYYLLKTTSFSSWIPYILSVGTSILLTGLTGGRIWWLGREMRANLLVSDKDYNTAAGMILESGAVYSAFIIAFLITGWVHATNKHCSGITVIHNLLEGALPQIINIAPTLIIARVGASRVGNLMTATGASSAIPNLTFAPAIGLHSLPSTN